MKDLTGTRLGQYEIVERLGGGGMAVVYRAVQQPLGREIALKALSSELFQDEGFVKRFETEAKTLAMLADFGLARGAGQPTHLTTIGLAIGTPGYMAPEQVMGHDVDKRADVYAMGVLTFEMLTGRLPFVGSNRMEVAYATVNTPIPSAVKINANLPDELDALLQKVLAKDPGQRPQTVRELLAQMARLPQRRTSPPGVAAVSPLAPAATPAGGGAVLPPPAAAANGPGPGTTSMKIVAPAAPASPQATIHRPPIP